MKGNVEYREDGQIFQGIIPHIMGTRLEMLSVGVSREQMLVLWDELYNRAFRLDSIMNRFDENSEVYRLNLSDDPSAELMSSELAEIFEVAQEYKYRTMGLFDVLYNSGKLDFGGFGKGYFLKECESVLRKGGVTCAFVNFGNSSILGIGHHPFGDSWKVGVVDPYTNSVIKEISLVDQAMSTSGNTPRYTGHIHNPSTGQAYSGSKLVSVVSTDPLDVEVLSTTFMLSDDSQIQQILSNFPEAHYERIR